MRSLRLFITVGLASLSGCNLVASTSEPVAIIVTSPPILTCEELVVAAVDLANDACIELESGEACYGHAQVTAEFQPDSAVRFNLPGDMAELTAIRSLSTHALSEAAQTWGIAVLKASIEQQTVMFVLYGEATLDRITPEMGGATLGTGSAPACAPPPAMLAQSPEAEQISLNLNGVEITFGSTIHVSALEDQAMTITAIEGTVVVAAHGAARIVHPGAQVRTPLDGLEASGAPSGPAPFDLISIQRAPLLLLDRPVQLPRPIAGPTIPPIGSTLTTSTLPAMTIAAPATSEPADCEIRSDWTGTYTVQRGENLSSIARRFGLTVRELQEGNCIANPNLIRAGQVLHLPNATATRAPAITPTGAATPTTALFRADQTMLAAGQCTTIRWDVDNAQEVYFEEQATTGHQAQEVCPQETKSYRLVVVYPDGRQVPYTLRIEVAAPPVTTEEAR